MKKYKVKVVVGLSGSVVVSITDPRASTLSEDLTNMEPAGGVNVANVSY